MHIPLYFNIIQFHKSKQDASSDLQIEISIRSMAPTVFENEVFSVFASNAVLQKAATCIATFENIFKLLNVEQEVG
jgi:hypothetical protein